MHLNFLSFRYFHLWIHNWVYQGAWRFIIHATKDVQKSKYIFVSYDEFNTIDNQSWLYVHVYVTKKMEKTPYFAELAKDDWWIYY